MQDPLDEGRAFRPLDGAEEEAVRRERGGRVQARLDEGGEAVVVL